MSITRLLQQCPTFSMYSRIRRLAAVHQERVSIGQLISNMGDYLANSDTLLRARGTLLVGEVLSRYVRELSLSLSCPVSSC